MRRWVIIVSAVVMGMLLIFSLGYVIGRGSDLATVEIQNRASKAVSTAMVEHDRGRVAVSSIGKRSRMNAVFYAQSRTDYRLIVTFEDGRTIRSDVRQVGPGDTVTEIVTDSVIVRAY